MPGQHPSELTQLTDFQRVEGELSQLSPTVDRNSILIRELQGKVAALGASHPPVVPVLPAAPTDGQEVYFATGAANAPIWHLRYSAAAAALDSYGWQFMGGSPLNHEVGAVYTLAAGTGIYVDSGAGPVLTAPLPGHYAMRAGYNGYQTTDATANAVAAGVSVNGDDPNTTGFFGQVLSTNGQPGSTEWERTFGPIAGGVQLKLLYFRSTTKTHNYRNRFLFLTPVRVKAA